MCVCVSIVVVVIVVLSNKVIAFVAVALAVIGPWSVG